MASCGLSSHVGGTCGANLDNPANVECVPLSVCNKRIQGHLRSLNVRDGSLVSESQLILARAGLFDASQLQNYQHITVCPRHRDSCGIRWRCNRRNCTMPSTWATHHKKASKGDRGISSIQSKRFFENTGQLIPVGSPICRRCRENLDQASTDSTSTQPVDEMSASSTVEKQAVQETPEKKVEESSGHASSDNDKKTDKTSSDSCDSLTEGLSQLGIHDDTSKDPNVIFSEGTLSSGSSEDQLTAVTSSEASARRHALNHFLITSGKEDTLIGPTKKRWESMTTRAHMSHVSKATNVIVAALDVITPGDGGLLWKAVQESKKVDEALGVLPHADEKYVSALAETYRNAMSWDTRRQVLSIMADLLSLNEIRKYIPRLTEYRWKMARVHRLQYGRGAPLPTSRICRIRVDEGQLDHFLSFITSPHIVQDLPFGQRYLKLSNGEVVETPNVVRSMIASRICKQYIKYCEETAFKPFSEATMRRTLTACAATERKSLQGLDYYHADGSKAFDDLSKIVKEVQQVHDREWAENCERALREGKQYIKADFKVHIADASQVPDHCLKHALSSPKQDKFAGPCSHQHDMSCCSCEELKTVLDDIKDTVTESKSILSIDQFNDISFRCSQAIDAIFAWKSHEVRFVQQDIPRHTTIANLTSNEVMITEDWAMKFLPQKYRETQSNWFGKRGISWHISVVNHKSPTGELQQQTFVHIAKNCNQDTDTVIPIMEHTLCTIKQENPDINTAYYRHDNAGCYHSVPLIIACHLMEKSTGIKVARVDFSEPQGGKGSCDRKAANIKAHIRRHLNEGNDVETPEDLYKAITSGEGVRGVRVALVDAGSATSINTGKLEGISMLNNFSYSEDGLTCWRAYGIGKGKTEKWSSLKAPETLTTVKFQSPFSAGDFENIASRAIRKSRVLASEDPDCDESDSDVDEGTGDSSPKLFSCPVEGCIRVYQRYSSLERHLECGKCQLKQEKETLYDKAKKLYTEKLLAGKDSQPELASTLQETQGCSTLQRGWALKESKKGQRFSEKQKMFLDEKFNKGKVTGHKMDPDTVAHEMRFAKDFDGNPRFKITEFLSATQIQGYFSRRAAKDRRGLEGVHDDETHRAAAMNEEYFAGIRKEILDDCQLSHPIIYDSIDLCQLYAEGKLKKLSVALLQAICIDLQVDVADLAKCRFKAPYIERIAKLVAQCTCEGTAGSS